MANETIADIIAEMRNRAKRPDFVSQDVLKSCADRLEAARKREAAFHAMTCEANDRLREHLQIALDADKRERGDAAKLRKFARLVSHMNDDADSIAMREPTGAIGKLAFHIKHTGDSALAAPPRNCERFATAEEADAAYRRFCDSEIAKIPLDAVDYSRERAKIPTKDKWLFAPATEKEGGAK